MKILITGGSWRAAVCVAALFVWLTPITAQNALAQSPSATPASAPLPADAAFTRQEIEPLVAPYALYPDALLAQVLPASAYPVDIVQVARWLAKNKSASEKGDFSTLDAQSWDASVKSLARFPSVIEKLNADLDATTDLGDAFVNQPDDVASVIQTLRRKAQEAGALQSNPQQKVSVQTQDSVQYVIIEPANPEVLYVPTYDPAFVYNPGGVVAAGLIGFGLGVAVGVAIDDPWDWRRGYVYPPRWGGYPGYRGNNINVGNVNVGNNVNIGGGNTRPWRPDGDRYRPGQGSKPAIGSGNRNSGNTVNIDRSSTNVVNSGNSGNRTNVNTGDRTKVGGGDRATNVSGGDRTKAVANAGNRPAAGKAVAEKKPQQPVKKPSAPARDTAFSDTRMGGAANAASQRGAASRQAAVQRGGGGRGGAAVGAGGRGGGGAARGGGGGGGRGGGGRGR